MANINIEFYHQHASTLCEQYQSVKFVDVHQSWLNHLPNDGVVLDIGAGSGRDSAFMASKGLHVTAVEPANDMRKLAKQKHNHPNIHWLNDTLPELKQVFGLQLKYDLILLSAVWMHIPQSKRERAFRKLSALLKPNGKLIITLRHGECNDDRIMHPVSSDELAKFANQFGLSFQHTDEADKLGRSQVYWQTVVMSLPDDGTGAFPLLRNIVVNDSKSSTYKIALLRTLLRIAVGHAGAVIDQTDDQIELPLGLVALYWLKLYKPLIDKFDMQQQPNAQSSLQFIQPNGWQELTSYTANDFYIGAQFHNEQLSKQVFKALKDISATIKQMPTKYITIPGTKDAVFEVKINRCQFNQKSLILNADLLKGLGSFYVPKQIWHTLSRFSVWIEPVLVNEWSTLMSNYKLNKEKQFSQIDYLNALQWEDAKRSTHRVRNRVEQLMTQGQIHCVWSNKKIRCATDYVIDHTFPFARWPNNDLWNLVPAKAAINSEKSDKLPSASKLTHCRSDIINWWQKAWQQDKEEFFIQANFALPNLTSDNQSFDDVFEALTIQRNRIKDFQQLVEWS